MWSIWVPTSLACSAFAKEIATAMPNAWAISSALNVLEENLSQDVLEVPMI
jgi:hypothetical protein